MTSEHKTQTGTKRLSQLADECEQLIRQGKSVVARRTLLQLDRSKINRSLRAQFANLFRRSGLPDVSIGLLHRIVRPQNETANDATPEEKTNYAAALIAIGASSEGLQLLSEVPTQDLPDALLQRAIGHFTRWEYPEAIPMLHQLISHPGATEYQLIVARLNLASALIIENQVAQAEELLAEMRHDLADRQQLGLVLGNVYELSAQTAIHHRDHVKAREYIDASVKLQSLHMGITALFLLQTKAINNALDPANRTLGIKELQVVADEARKAREWETCRDAHFHLSRALKDDAGFLKVYFGTPHANYRRRMLREYPSAPAIPKEYICLLQGQINSYPLVFDTISGQLEGSSNSIDFANLPHRLLYTLSTDLFRRFRVPKLFADLFPTEYFDPLTSPDRVHSIVIRLRKELRDKEFPLVVLHERDGYSLSSTGSVALRLHQETFLGDRHQMQFEKFRRMWIGGREFSKSDMEIHLELSTSVTARILRWALQNKMASRSRNGKAAVYKLAG